MMNEMKIDKNIIANTLSEFFEDDLIQCLLDLMTLEQMNAMTKEDV